jgi:hypothetical protein
MVTLRLLVLLACTACTRQGSDKAQRATLDEQELVTVVRTQTSYVFLSLVTCENT